MAAKGSRKNPYTLSEYNGIGSDSWTGGWVQESENYVIYRNRFKTVTYTGFCTKGNPVPGDLYNEMTQNHIWLGGWVLFGTIKKYVDSNDDEYNSTLGTQSDPCSMFIYNEMISNGIWEGGWVQDSNGQAHYMQNFNLILDFGSGCGCGCGCGYGSGYGSGAYSGSCPAYGSGSGSNPEPETGTGCPINAGSHEAGVVQLINKVEIHRGTLTISWTSGKTIGYNDLSVATITIIFDNSSVICQSSNVVTIWENAYELSIQGTLLITCNGKQKGFAIRGSFYVPSEYHQ